MSHRVYSFKSKVWLTEGFGAWHFVSVPKTQSEEIKSLYGSARRRGWGSIPVNVTAGSSAWKTSIFPSKDGEYVLALKQSIRQKEKIFEGETINVRLEIIEIL